MIIPTACNLIASSTHLYKRSHDSHMTLYKDHVTYLRTDIVDFNASTYASASKTTITVTGRGVKGEEVRVCMTKGDNASLTCRCKVNIFHIFLQRLVERWGGEDVTQTPECNLDGDDVMMM